MGDYFLYHFLEDGYKRVSRGVNDKWGNLSALGRLESILQSKSIEGNNRKGYYQHKFNLPKSVSFSAADLGELLRFFLRRSPYALAFHRGSSALEYAKPVLYLTRNQIKEKERGGSILEVDLPFVDLIEDDNNTHPYRYQWHLLCAALDGNQFTCPDNQEFPGSKDNDWSNKTFYKTIQLEPQKNQRLTVTYTPVEPGIYYPLLSDGNTCQSPLWWLGKDTAL